MGGSIHEAGRQNTFAPANRCYICLMHAHESMEHLDNLTAKRLDSFIAYRIHDRTAS